MPYFGNEPGETTKSTVVGAYNYLINGEMRVATRGLQMDTGFNDDDMYTLDQWILLSESNDGVDVTQTTTVPSGGAVKSMGLDVEIANEMFGICQIIENKNCGGLIGNEVTLSFQAKVTDARIGDVRAYILAWDGTADSVTSDVVATWNDDANPTFATNWTAENTGADLGVTTSFAKYSVTANIDTSNATNVAVFIACVDDSVNAGDFLYITDVQLENGDTASDYVREDMATTSQKCHRYLQRVLGGGNNYTYMLGMGNSSNQVFGGMRHMHGLMRVAPTGSVFSASTMQRRDGSGSNETSSTQILLYSPSTHDFSLIITAATVTANTVYHIEWNGTGWIQMSAEL